MVRKKNNTMGIRLGKLSKPNLAVLAFCSVLVAILGVSIISALISALTCGFDCDQDLG